MSLSLPSLTQGDPSVPSCNVTCVQDAPPLPSVHIPAQATEEIMNIEHTITHANRTPPGTTAETSISTINVISMPPKKKVAASKAASDKVTGAGLATPRASESPTKRTSARAELDSSSLIATRNNDEVQPTPSPVKKPRKAAPRKAKKNTKTVEDPESTDSPIKRAPPRSRRVKSTAVPTESDPVEGTLTPPDEPSPVSGAASPKETKSPNTVFTSTNADEIPGNFSSNTLSQHAVQFLINTIVENATAEKKWTSWAKMLKDCGTEVTGTGLKKQIERAWLTRLQGMYKK